jgi:flagellar basal-body rod protein FlgC
MKLDSMSGMNTSASALSAYRRWMDAVAENLANAQTTRTAEGGPYRRQQVTFEAVAGRSPAASQAPQSGGLEPTRTHPTHLRASAPPTPTGPSQAPGVIGRVAPDQQTPFQQVYDPSHPDADAEGWVSYPNVNPVTEMVNLILASRAYEANVAALAAEQRMQEQALSIGRP